MRKKVKVADHLKIRMEDPEKQKKRVENALYRNRLRQAEVANQYKMELQRIDSALHKHPENHIRQAILMNRGVIKSTYDSLKIT